ncbi:hypothetical protein M0811_12607 [Anaeramoeba ignava]|uniref:Uncharacterized protein n=1 Tax=Anaeramoeba ignava TaxID=1746090 RepID=A0A9Q0L874_ANAIG|nr:hypothetical protein M0811_12607 [Anaeramoeba ignava]
MKLKEFEDIFKGSEKEYGKSEIKVILVKIILDKIKLEEIQGKSQTLKFPITKELFEDIVVEIFGQDQIKKYVYDLIEDFIQNGNKAFEEVKMRLFNF